MLIHVEVPLGVDPQVERAVTGHKFEHVVEETDSGRDLVAALSFEPQSHEDLRLFRPTIDQRAAHRTSSMAATARRVCSTIPVAIRMQPAQPGSVDRSRK